MSVSRFEAFGISVSYLPEWKIVPDPGHYFEYSSGFVRFEERGTKQASRISFGLRWEYSESSNEVFLEEFREKIRKESQKKFRGKSSGFSVLKDELALSEAGIKICMMETEYTDSQALFKTKANRKLLRVCNSAFYSDSAHRIVICSLITTPDMLEENRELYDTLLKSAHAVPVFTAEEEAEIVKTFRKPAQEKTRLGFNKKSA